MLINHVQFGGLAINTRESSNLVQFDRLRISANVVPPKASLFGSDLDLLGTKVFTSSSYWDLGIVSVLENFTAIRDFGFLREEA